MGFELKSFKKSNQVINKNQPPQFIKEVIIGDDLSSVIKLVELSHTHHPDQLKLFTTKILTKEILQESLSYCVSGLSQVDKVEALKNSYPGLEFTSDQDSAVFYKDGKWHDFEGRARPMHLLHGEKAFIDPRLELKLESFFSPDDFLCLDDILREYVEVKYLQDISKTHPTDLVNQEEWLLEFKDFHRITCHKLNLACEKKYLLQATQNGVSLPSDMAQILVELEAFSGVSVTFETTQSILPHGKIYFMPQSFTHEWGHFMIRPHEKIGDQNFFTTISFLLHQEDVAPEDVASKIKLLKRSIERVSPDFEKSIIKEHILFQEEMWITPPSQLPNTDKAQFLAPLHGIHLH